MKYFIAFLSSCVFCVSSVIGQTAPEASFSGPGRVDLSASAQDWNLAEEDWERYKTLMKGEAGLFWSHMTPSYVLSMYETNPDKRKNYAQQSLNEFNKRKDRVIEAFRIQTLMAASMSSESKEKTIDSERFDQASELFTLANIVSKQNALQSPVIPRCAFFVRLDDCDKCLIQARTVIDQGALDIYFVGIERSDETSEKIFKWAIQNGITQAQLDSGNITINYDDADIFAKLGGGDLPRLYNTPKGKE